MVQTVRRLAWIIVTKCSSGRLPFVHALQELARPFQFINAFIFPLFSLSLGPIITWRDVMNECLETFIPQLEKRTARDADRERNSYWKEASIGLFAPTCKVVYRGRININLKRDWWRDPGVPLGPLHLALKKQWIGLPVAGSVKWGIKGTLTSMGIRERWQSCDLCCVNGRD